MCKTTEESLYFKNGWANSSGRSGLQQLVNCTIEATLNPECKSCLHYHVSPILEIKHLLI